MPTNYTIHPDSQQQGDFLLYSLQYKSTKAGNEKTVGNLFPALLAGADRVIRTKHMTNIRRKK